MNRQGVHRAKRKCLQTIDYNIYPGINYLMFGVKLRQVEIYQKQ